MLAGESIPTSINNRTTVNTRNPMFNLVQEMKIRNFSTKTISLICIIAKKCLGLQINFLMRLIENIKDYIEYLLSTAKVLFKILEL